MTITASRACLIIAVVLELLLLICAVASIPLPKPEAWQIAAFLAFFLSFLF